jgi:hypothetical protein
MISPPGPCGITVKGIVCRTKNEKAVLASYEKVSGQLHVATGLTMQK